MPWVAERNGKSSPPLRGSPELALVWAREDLGEGANGPSAQVRRVTDIFAQAILGFPRFNERTLLFVQTLEQCAAAKSTHGYNGTTEY